MSTTPTPQPDIVTQMVQDPDFAKMSVQEQRKALAAHDPIFQQADDGTIGQFVQAHQAKTQTQIQQPPQPPGLLQRFGQAVGIPTSMQDLQAMAPKNWQDVADVALGGPAAAGQRLLQGFTETAGRGLKEGFQESVDAGKNAQQLAQQGKLTPGELLKQGGKVGAAAMHSALQSTPVVGPALENYGSDISQRNYPGAIGGGLGVATTLAAPEIANKIPPNSVLGRALLLGRTPEGAYADSLKPSTTMSQAERANVIGTGLKEGIPVSKGGLEDIGNRIQSLNQQIADVVATDPTRPIDPRAAIQNLGQVRQRFTNQVNPRADLAAINASGEEFAENQHLPPEGAEGPVQPMNAADAQAMKQGTYQALGDKAYGEVGSASKEAQKALARGLKEELAQQFPELNDLNARDGRLIDLQNSLERAVARIGNRRLVGIDAPLAAAAVRAATDSNKLAAGAGFMKAVLDYPGIQSRLAIALSQGKIPSPLVIPKIAAYGGALQRLSSPGLPFLQSQQQPSGNSAQSPNQ